MGAQGPLRRDSEECVGVDERREVSLPDDAVVDDQNVIVLATSALTPVPDVSSVLVEDALHVLTTSADWLQLYEAVVLVRRVMVHHSQVLTTRHVESLVRPLALESDSLRSAPSKNGLLACAECLEFVPRSMVERVVLSGAPSEMLDVLLRRSICENKFLRDTALLALQKLATHLAGVPLLAAIARYGSHKNGKLCGSAAKMIALSLERLVQIHRTVPFQANGAFTTVFRALVAFRESKDAGARTEAARSFQHLCVLLGIQALELGLKDAVSRGCHAGTVARILKDASTKGSAASPRAQTRSLRDRVRPVVRTNCH